jgi:RHS repeat-associated protein
MQERRGEHDLPKSTPTGLRGQEAPTTGYGPCPPSGGRGAARRLFYRPRRGRAFTRRMGPVLLVLLLTQLALVISAVACQGTGGPPAVLEPVVVQGSSSKPVTPVEPSPVMPVTVGSGPNPGAPGVPQEICGKSVNCATGDESTEQTDIAIGGRGPGLSIVRAYDAQAAAAAQAEGKSVGLWGWGWTGPYEAKLVLGEPEPGIETATVQQQNGSGIVFYKNEKGEYEQGAWAQARLVKESTKYIYTLPDQSKLEFNSEGRLVKEADRNGNANTLTYNGSKQLEKVTDGAKRSLTFKYNGEGLVESIKDPRGNSVSYTYTATGLSTVSIEGKVRWEFGYTAESPHLLSSVTDGRKHATTLEYDGSNRVIEETIAGHERKWKYGEGETAITEPNGSETVDTFNAAMEPTKIIQAKGTGAERATEYEYSGTTFELTKMIDPNKHVTEYGYDEEGNRTSEKNPAGDERKWEYDKNHNIVKETSPEGETTTIKRDESGNPEVIERPVGSETQKAKYKYDASGDLTEVIDPLGHVTQYTYDTEGNRATKKDAEGNERKWKYNEDHAVKEETDPRNFTTKLERNQYDLPIKIMVPTGQATEYKYDGNQNVEAETDRNKHTTKYEYNEENLRTKVTEPNGITNETGYDAEGQMTSHTDGNGHTWEYKRNQLGQVTEEENPLGKIWEKTYDQAGNLEKLEDPEKHTTEYGHDESDRRSKIKYSTETPSEVTFGYNKDGKVTKMKDETGTTENTWDKLDRLTEYTNGAGKVVKYGYDLAGEPIKITYPNGEHITREYDKDNRLEKVTDWKGNATSFKYDADSNLATTTFPAGTENKDEYLYNEDDVTKEVKVLQGATLLGSLLYTHDGAGQVKLTTSKKVLGVEKHESIYDENNRLIEAEKHVYEYDKGNNPNIITDEGIYTYNEANELEKGHIGNYEYNEDGQRTKFKPAGGEPTTTYGYDQAGNFASLERAKGTKEPELNEAYTYDGTNLRQTQSIDGTKANFTWDTAESTPIPMSDETNSYIYGPGNLPIEQIGGTTPLYLHHDQQGSTRMLTNSAGEVAGQVAYGPFGNVKEATGAGTALEYDGQLQDRETGFVYLRARVYDPSTTQFLSIDPRIESTGEAYSYARNNPENGQDLTGACTGTLDKKVLLEKCLHGAVSALEGSLALMVVTGPASAVWAVALGCVGSATVAAAEMLYPQDAPLFQALDQFAKQNDRWDFIITVLKAKL